MARSNEEQIRFANDEILGRGNLDVVDEVFAPDYVAHGGGKEFTGTAFVRRYIGLLRTAMRDLRVVKVELRIEAGDTIVWERTTRGTHEADMMGIPPTGHPVEWRDRYVSRFEGGRIAEDRTVSDLAGRLLLKSPRR